MKRDLDLIRVILKDLEEAIPRETIDDTKYHDRYDGAVVRYNMNLLVNEGFVIKDRIQLSDREREISYINLKELTWKGNDFIKAAQDDSLWNKAKTEVIKPTASWTFDLLLEWLKAEARTKIGLP